MKTHLRKSLWSLVSFFLLTGCAGNKPSVPPADDSPTEVPPVIDDDPTDVPPVIDDNTPSDPPRG